MATLYLQAKVGSTDYGNVGSGAVSNAFLRLVSFGAYGSGGAHFDIRDIKVGTTTYGSSDLYAPALTSLADFDGVVGNDGSIVVSGGVLSVDDDAFVDHYGWKDLGSDITDDLYVHFQLKIRGGDDTEEYHAVWDDSAQASTDGADVVGIFNNGSSWWWDNFGDAFGTGAVVDTWVTVNIHYSFTEPPPPSCDCSYADNGTQGTAVILAGSCVSGPICNNGAPTTAADIDPLNTVYGAGETYSRQVWYRLDNPDGVPRYVRFTLTNLSPGNVDVAAAIYTDDPASIGTFSQVAGDHNWNDTTLSTGASTSFGAVVPAGGSAWLEVGGNDFRGQGWDCELELTWALLPASVYDTLDDGFEGLTEYRGSLQGPVHGVHNVPAPWSYCKKDDLHFAAVDDYSFVAGGSTGSFYVWVWPDGGGAPTIYDINGVLAAFGETAPVIAGATGIDNVPDQGPLLRTDGEHVWLVCYVGDFARSHCIPPDNPDTVLFEYGLYVLVWNGAGFTVLGSDVTYCFEHGGLRHEVGILTAAASSTEPGVLHVVWSEAGATSCDVTPDWNTYLHYSRWSPTAAVVAGAVISSGQSPPVVTGIAWLTSIYGQPILFYGQMTSYSPAFQTLAMGSVLDMYSLDEATGAATHLQSFTPDAGLYPAATFDKARASGNFVLPQHTYHSDDALLVNASWFYTGEGGAPPYSPLLWVPGDGSGPMLPVTDAGGSITNDQLGGMVIDADNIWAVGPSGFTPGTAILSGSLECDHPFPLGRGEYVCNCNGAGLYTTIYIARFVRELYYDPVADAFYTLGFHYTTITDGTSYQFAPVKIPVLRDYLPCSVTPCPGGARFQAASV